MTPAPQRDGIRELGETARAALAAGRDEDALAAYAEAARLCREQLPVTDPDRLALAAAHADAWFDRGRDAERAFDIARAAYDDAIAEIDETEGEQRRNAVRELGNLRDKLTFWAFTMDANR